MPALVTPFDGDGELDLDAHAHNVSFVSDLGIEGLVLAGSNGEGFYLDPGERRTLIETARRVVPGAHVMMCIMAESVRAGLRQIDESRSADSLLVLTPTTLARGRPDAVHAYFEAIADVSELPVFLYSVPPVSVYSMEIELITELARHPRVAGMKDSSGDVVRLQAIVDATPDDFVLYSGASAAVTAAMTVGCHGVITGSVNYAAQLVMDTVSKVPNRELQSRLTTMSAAVEAHGIPGVKVAAAAHGLRPGLPRLPLRPVSDDIVGRIVSAVTT